ncbi:pterin-4-alpha-carbinolamine dehydratase family protein [Pleurotus pulmonarius]
MRAAHPLRRSALLLRPRHQLTHTHTRAVHPHPHLTSTPSTPSTLTPILRPLPAPAPAPAMAHTQRRCSSSTDASTTIASTTITSSTTTSTTTTTTPSSPSPFPSPPSRQHTPPITLPAPLAPPDPVSGWPTPWLSAPDFARYMHALHASGWRIRFSAAPSKPTHSPTDNHPPTPRTVPELRKTLRCADGGACARFVAEVQGLMAQENHHCVVHVADAQVSIYTHTHSARPAPGSKSAPGLTLRDVRLAMLIDGLPSCGSAATDVGDASSTTMLTWEGYQNALRDSMALVGM